MQKTMALALCVSGYLPDQRHHRRVQRVGCRQGGCGVEKARPGHNAIDLRLAGGQRRAGGHIGRALFMPCLDRRDHVGMVEQRIEKMVVLHAGQAVELVDAIGDQRLDGECGDGGVHNRCWLREALCR